jgi:hypothetical protein
MDTTGNAWVKSSLSFANGNCVEVMDTGSTVVVRNSRNPHGAVLEFTRDEWAAFIGGAMLGEFDQFG